MFQFDEKTFATFADADAAHRAATRAAVRTGAYPGPIVEIDQSGRRWDLTEYGRRVAFVHAEMMGRS